MKVQAIVATSLLLSAAPVLAERPSLERVAANAHTRCEMKQQRIPAGKTMTVTPENCAEAGRQAKAAALARRADRLGGTMEVAAE